MILVNGKRIKFTNFPNGETHVDTSFLNKLLIGDRVRVDFKYLSDSSIVKLLFVLGHLEFYTIGGRDIFIHYMPYSRMDRAQDGNCFSLLHVCKMLNRHITSSDRVFVVEPHSDVTLRLLDNSARINMVTPLMNRILKLHPEINMICYPDKGAKNRFQDDTVKLPVVYCNKVRDFKTGEILGLELDGTTDVSKRNILILDDLCSKGGTFYHTANKLKEHGANNIYLGVCHMEETVKQGRILQEYKNWDDVEISPIKHIYCCNTMLEYVDFSGYTNITVFDLNLKEIKDGLNSL